MLVVIFGAGASFDSDPAQPATAAATQDRPPLANSLFDVDGQVAREAAAAFPRAAPALMAARADVAAAGTVEQTLSRLQAGAEGDPRARSQLMALRFYLQRVLTETPQAWQARAVGQTSYVSLLDQLARWQNATGQDLCLVTFNYDTLLEQTVQAVYGYTFGQIDDYQRWPGVRLYKPHGSVDWAQAARWDGVLASRDAARRLVCDQPDVDVLPGDIERRSPEKDVLEARPVGSGDIAWLPALAIPVERKPDVILPRGHQQALQDDLGAATTVLSIGWRAREEYFLHLLQAQLPPTPIRCGRSRRVRSRPPQVGATFTEPVALIAW